MDIANNIFIHMEKESTISLHYSIYYFDGDLFYFSMFSPFLLSLDAFVSFVCSQILADSPFSFDFIQCFWARRRGRLLPQHISHP